MARRPKRIKIKDQQFKNYKVMTQFPLLDALRGVESEVTKRGKEIALKGTSEQRAVATIGKPNTFFIPFESRAVMSASTSQANIGNERQELIFPLEENLVLAKAGARIVTGLTGNALYPKSTGAVVNWAGENEKAADGAGQFSLGKKFTPKRLTATVEISRELLSQDAGYTENALRQLLAGAIAQKIEETAFSKAAASTDIPDGLFQTAPTDKGAISWSRFLAMELALADNKALTGNLAYVLNPTIANKAKSTLKDSTGAGGFIINDYPGNMLNGYPMFQSGYVPGEFESEIETDEEQAETLSDSLNPVNLESAPADDNADESDESETDNTDTVGDQYGVIFGNWNDYFIGFWGAMEITVDPYTKADDGMVRLILNVFAAMGSLQSESFTTASMK